MKSTDHCIEDDTIANGQRAHHILSDRPANDEDQADSVHPTAARWFAVVPWLRGVPIFGTVIGSFGPKFTLSLATCYLISKGIGSNIINVSRQPMFTKRYGLEVIQYQRLAYTYSLGWSMKSFVAVITDAFPFCGYSKRWYLTVSAVMGTAFTLAYALMPGRASSANAAAAFVFLSCFSKANIDILSESIFSRKIRFRAHAGAQLISMVWAMTFAGTLISAAIMGPLSDANLAYVGVVICAGLQFLTIFLFVLNTYEEKKNRVERYNDALLAYKLRIEAVMAITSSNTSQSATERQEPIALPDRVPAIQTECKEGVPGKGAAALMTLEGRRCAEPFVAPDIVSCLGGVIEFNRQLVRENWRLVLLGIIITFSVLTLTCLTILGTKWHLLYGCVVVAVVMCVMAFFTLPLAVAKAAVFMFFQAVLYIQISAALSTFYMADGSCLPDAPHFTYKFYITVASLVADAAGVAGSVLFAYVFSRRSYVFVFVVTMLLQVIGSIFDLIIVKRWNEAIGIPDKLLYLFGDSVVYRICFTLNMMPQQILMSRLCPRGTEAMMFASMAGFVNVGTSMAGAVGSLLLEHAWPVRNKPSCDYSNLPWLIITGHFGTPLLVIPLALLLLPRARICDNIDAYGHIVTPMEPEEVQVTDVDHKTTSPPHEAERGDAGNEDASTTPARAENLFK